MGRAAKLRKRQRRAAAALNDEQLASRISTLVRKPAKKGASKKAARSQKAVDASSALPPTEEASTAASDATLAATEIAQTDLEDGASTTSRRPEKQPPKKQDSQRGSCYQLVRSMTSDEWQTTLAGWRPAATVLKNRFRQARIWQPFYYDGECKKHLHALGFKRVHHRPGEDFFKMIEKPNFLSKIDFIWDNPPYTSPETKQQVLQGLKKTNKPFCMLLPIAIIHSAFVRDLFDMDKVQLLIPRKVEVRKKNQAPVPFKLLLWFCYNMKLERDLYFLSE